VKTESELEIEPSKRTKNIGKKRTYPSPEDEDLIDTKIFNLPKLDSLQQMYYKNINFVDYSDKLFELESN
jgi:hypothetical protein